ncbi:reverse transcriptase domain-containing protein [Tanacetum coccineum]
MLKFLQIFQRLHFDLSFAEALLHIPKFASTFKSLLSNKEKLFELANTSLNENYKCLALADLGASINLIPLSVWKKLSLSELTPTRMTLELANQSVAYPVGVAEDVFVKVGKFHFLTDFVVVDYDVDPRVPLILGRPFLRTARALIDVYGKELILRDGDEQLIFHVDNTLKHPHESINMINFIDITCEDRFSEVLKFKKSNHPSSGSTIPFSDSLLEEFADELTLCNPFPPGNKDDNFDLEADLRKIEYLLNQEPSTESSSKSDIEIIDYILERFIGEPAHVYSPPPGDDDNNKECDLPFFVTFSNPLFDFTDDFTSSDDVSFPIEDVQEENFKIYSNPLFEFNDEYISSDVNPLFNEVLEDIERGDIEVGYHDSKGDEIFLEYLLKKIASMDSSLLFSSGSEDIIFDPGISVFSFYSLELVDCPDYEDSCSCGFDHQFTQDLILSMLIYGNPIS